MQSRAAILDAINKTITRSESLTEQAKATHRGSVEAAFSGAGFPAETKAKLAMIRKIQPNSGFAKGSVADTFGSTGHPSDELFPQGTGEIHEFSAEDLVSVGPKPDAPEYYARFREIMASQYPTIQAMQNVNQESRSVDSVRGSSRDGDGAERPEGVQPVGDKRCKHGFPTCLTCGFKDGAKVKGK